MQTLVTHVRRLEISPGACQGVAIAKLVILITEPFAKIQFFCILNGEQTLPNFTAFLIDRYQVKTNFDIKIGMLKYCAVATDEKLDDCTS